MIVIKNELWKLNAGWLAGYTESKDLQRRIKRYKYAKGWRVMAEYTKNGRVIGVQFKIPINQRRQVERMFGVTKNKRKQAI